MASRTDCAVVEACAPLHFRQPFQRAAIRNRSEDYPRSRCWGSHYDVGEVTLVSDSTALLLGWLEYLAVLLVLGVVLLRRAR